jgi:hypothetical protein
VAQEPRHFLGFGLGRPGPARAPGGADLGIFYRKELAISLPSSRELPSPDGEPACSLGACDQANIHNRHYSGEVNKKTKSKYATLRRLGEFGRAVERCREPDPYPRASGPAPTVQELRDRRATEDIPNLDEQLAAIARARTTAGQALTTVDHKVPLA